MSDAEQFKVEKPSQIPSWIMVGFVIGALTMWAFQSGGSVELGEEVERVEAEIPEVEEPEVLEGGSNPMAREDQPSIEVVAALFDQFREYAFWSNGRTEIGVWNGKTLSFSDRFEVLEQGGQMYFRPISNLSRLPLEGYGPDASPLMFTETAEQRATRYFRANPELAPDANSRDPVEFDNLPPPPEPAG
jgi:hypothetical protein